MKKSLHRLILILSRNNFRPKDFSAVLLVGLLSLPSLGLAADATRVTTKPGREFSITLNSNPTTGYQWQLAKPVAGACVALVTNQFVRPKSKLTGAPGKEVWKFKALRPGEAEIQLEYVRVWEKGVEPAQKTNVMVIVAGPKPVQ